MKVKLNVKFALMLLGVCAVLGFSAFLLNRYQTRRSATVVLKLAREALAAENYSEAIQQYAKYTRIVPSAHEALIELADTLRKVGRFQEAFFNYEKALQLKEDDHASRQSLVETALDLERPVDAETHLVKHLLPHEPANPAYQWLLGRCQQAQNQNDQALNSFRQAVHASPTDSRFAASLAALLSEQFKQHEEARQVLDNMVSKAGDDPRAAAARALWLLGRYRQLAPSATEERAPQLRELIESAWRDCQAAVARQSKSPEFVVLMAEVALARKSPDEALPLLESLRAEQPKIPAVYFATADLLTLQGKSSEALSILRQGFEQLPQYPPLVWRLAAAEFVAGNDQATKELVTKLQELKAPEGIVRYLQSQLLARAGQWREAATMAEQARPLLDRTDNQIEQIDFFLAECYRRLGDYDQELTTLRRVVSQAPNSQRGREALAEALLRQGKVDEAKAEYQVLASQQQTSVRAMLEVCRLGIIQCLDLPKEHPRWQEIQRLIGELEKLPEAAVDVAILKAEMLAAQNQPTEAQQVLKDQLQQSAQSTRLYQALIALFARSKSWANAADTLQQMKTVLGDSFLTRLEEAQLLVKQFGAKEKVEQLQALAQAPANWSEDQKINLAAGMTSLLLEVGLIDLAGEQVRYVASTEQGRSSVRVQQLLFDVGLSKKDLTAMNESLEAIGKLEGNGPQWQLNKAILLTLEGDQLQDDTARHEKLNQAMLALREAQTKRPGWARIQRQQAEIYERLKQTKSALKSYLAAFDLGDNDPQMVARTIYFLYQEKRFTEADKIVRTLQEKKVSFTPDLARVASDVSLGLQDYDRALELALSRSQETRTADDQAWLGQVYAAAGKDQEAEAAFREATRLDVQSPAGWLSLLQFLIRKQRLADARQLVAQAQSSLGAEGQSMLGQCYEILEDFGQAQACYQQALERNPEDWPAVRRLSQLLLRAGQASAAEKWLIALTGEDSSIDRGDRRWARRQLAMLLIGRPDQKLKDEAHALVDINLMETPDDTDDQLAKARLLSAQSDLTSTRTAVDIVEKVIQQTQLYSLADNAFLADLYLRLGDWIKYSKQMRSLMGNGGAENPQYVKTYAQALLARGETDEANLWFDKLKRLAPNEAATLNLEASLILAAGDFARLLTLLEKTYQDPAQQAWAIGMAQEVANTFSRVGKTDVSNQFSRFAEEKLKEKIQQDSGAKSQLAAFYVRRGTIAPALATLEGVNLTAEQVADLAFLAIESFNLDADNARLLIPYCEAAFERNNGSNRLCLSLGDLNTWIGDAQAATRYYQILIDRDPSNYAAHDNYASVLAWTGQDLEKAEQVIELAVRKFGPFDGLLDTRSLVRLAAGKTAAAREDILASIAQRPTPLKLFHLAQILVAEGKRDEALQQFALAQEQGLTINSLHPMERAAYEKLK